ncbi:hypothetical protein [Pseudonocardia sp. D17]
MTTPDGSEEIELPIEFTAARSISEHLKVRTAEEELGDERQMRDGGF